MKDKKTEVSYADGLYEASELIAGEVDAQYFRLLLSISSVSSQKMRQALEDILVHGCSRKEACVRNNVAPGNLSIKLQYIRFVNQTALLMHLYKYRR